MIDWLRRENAEPSLTLAGRDVPVAIRRHPTAKRMTMRLAPDGSEIRITVPRWGRTADALEFARSRRDWLEREIARAATSKAPPMPGGTLDYRGAEILITWAADAPRQPVLVEVAPQNEQAPQLRLGGPQDNLAQRLQRWLEGEAASLMETDLAHYCGAAGVEVPRLRLSRAQRRWGSCAGDGTIRINWRLVQAPDMVRRSVVAHEVAHLVHFDHGPDFHALLGSIFEADIKPANLWLKQHGRSLYARFG